MFERLLNALKLEDPSQYEEYYENVSWKTFRVSEDIWNDSEWKRPDIGYYRQLQHCYVQLLEEMGNSYLYDSDGIREEFNRIHFENCRLEKELAKAQGMIEILQKQLDSALMWQTAQGRKNEVFTANGLEPEEIKEQPKTNSKFASVDGKSKKQKMCEAVAMQEAGIDLDAIGSALNVSKATVRAYISTAKGHYTIYDMPDSRVIEFDNDYGGERWDLGIFATEKEDCTSTAGKIVRLAVG